MSDYLGYVIVERFPFGSTSFSQCTCDQFEADTVTVTSPAMNDRVMDVFAPGTWRTATAYDSNGHPLYGFISDQECEAQRVQFETLNAKGCFPHDDF